MPRSIIPETTLNQIQMELLRLQQQNVEDESIEVEARFGDFYGNNFQSGVTRQTFTRLKDWALGQYRGYTLTQSIDQLYPTDDSDKSTIRHTTIYNQSGEAIEQFRMIKTRIGNHNFPEHFLRVSLSREDTDNEPPSPNVQMISQREKTRWSFLIQSGNYRLDLTEVKTVPMTGNPNDEHTSYEIELEIGAPKLQNLQQFDPILKYILGQVLYTPLLYSATEKAGVISQVNLALGSHINQPNVIDNRMLIQARNLKLRDMVTGGLIPKTERDVRYTVTIKADGVRKLLYIGSQGIYLVSPTSAVMKILGPSIAQQLQTWEGTVIEGEFIPLNNLSPSAPEDYQRLMIYFLMYDTLSIGGDSRVQNQSLFERLEAIQQLERALRPLAYDRATGEIKNKRPMLFEKKHFLQFKTKKEFYGSVADVLTTDYPFLTDGLLFTPDNYHYDAEVSRLTLADRKLNLRPDLLKWKPRDQLTIDFQVNHIASRDLPQVELLSNASTRWPIKRIRSLDHIYREQLETGNDINRVVFEGSSDHPYSSQSNLLMNDLVKYSPSGVILEFRWTPLQGENTISSASTTSSLSNKGQLEAIRARYDKTIPNSIDIALDVWGDIFSPVDRETIIGEKFSLIFRYHNTEKRNLYNYVGSSLPETPVKSLLDIGTGRGGDVYKWIQNGFTHVVCVEPDQENRIELNRRLSQTSLNYRIVSTIGQDVETIVQNVQDFVPGGVVDTISYMLSLSFFFDNTESISTIAEITNRTLREEGYFIAFTIDGRYVQNLFEDNRYYVEANGTRRSNFQNIQFELRPSTKEIPTQHIFVNIPDTIVTNQIEYLTNLPDLKQLFSKAGLRLISESRATKEAFLTNEEILYSSLFTSIVFQREQISVDRGFEPKEYPFKQVQEMLNQQLFNTFEVSSNQEGLLSGNSRLVFIDHNGQRYETIAQYNPETNLILPPIQNETPSSLPTRDPPIIDFETVRGLLQRGEIERFEISQNQMGVNPGNTRMIFYDRDGNTYLTIAQYDQASNQINPPI
jgi:hypothetical protein